MISIIIPVVRPEKAERCVEAIKKYAGSVPYEIITEFDTKGIGCPKMVKQLIAETSGDMVMFLGDDTIPQEGFLQAALEKMHEFAGGWGLVALNDGIWNGTLATHWLAHKSMIPVVGGELFSTAYMHCFCDQELTDIARELGRYSYAPDAKIIHDHPLVTGEEYDEHYQMVYEEDVYKADLKTYRRRKIDRKGNTFAVGLPLAGTSRDDDFWLSFIGMDKPVDIKLYVPNIPIGEFGRDIAIIRNNLFSQAFNDGIAYLIMMDTDQIYPRDLITKMVKHTWTGKGIVVAPVHRRYEPFELILMKGEPDHYRYIPDDQKYSGRTIEIDASGTGCVMFDMRAILDVPEPWFELGHTPRGKPMGEDIGLCWKLRQAGHRIWADTSIEIDHIARIRINRAFYEIGKKVNRYEMKTDD